MNKNKEGMKSDDVGGVLRVNKIIAGVFILMGVFGWVGSGSFVDCIFLIGVGFVLFLNNWRLN